MIAWPLVRVTWTDSTGPQGWVSLEHATAPFDQTIESIGWMIGDEGGKVTLAAHIAIGGGANPLIDGVMTIPRCAIIDIQEWELA